MTRETGHTTHKTASGHDNALPETPYYVRERPGKSESGSGPRQSSQPRESAIVDRAQPRHRSRPREGQSERAQMTPESKRAPLLQPPRGKKQPSHTRPQKPRPLRSPPSSPTERQEGGEEIPRESTQETPSDFPARPHPSEGRKEGGGEREGRPTSKEAEAEGGGEVQWEGQSLNGKLYDAHYRSVSSKMRHRPILTNVTCHVMSAVHLTPLHLAHVRCRSLNMGDIKAPHLRPPTPRHSC